MFFSISVLERNVRKWGEIFTRPNYIKNNNLNGENVWV